MGSSGDEHDYRRDLDNITGVFEDYFLFDPGFRFFQFYNEPWATCSGHCCQSSGSFAEEFWNCADISVVNEGDTTLLPSTSQADDNCQVWCASQPSPWSAKCTWNGCSSCPECSNDVSTSTAPVTTAANHGAPIKVFHGLQG